MFERRRFLVLVVSGDRWSTVDRFIIHHRGPSSFDFGSNCYSALLSVDRDLEASVFSTLWRRSGVASLQVPPNGILCANQDAHQDVSLVDSTQRAEER